jgi:hypothetical protein
MPWEYTHCLIKHHAMKTYCGSGGIALRILDLGTRWRRVVSYTPRLLCPRGKNFWYPMDRSLARGVGRQSRSGRGGGEKNSQPLPGLEPPDHPDRSSALYHLAIPDLQYTRGRATLSRCCNTSRFILYLVMTHRVTHTVVYDEGVL